LGGNDLMNKLNNIISVKHGLIALLISGDLFFAGFSIYIIIGFSSQAGGFSALIALQIIWFFTLFLPIFGLSAVICGYVNAIVRKNYKWNQAIAASVIVTIPLFFMTHF
jgi:hypothetical protein